MMNFKNNFLIICVLCQTFYGKLTVEEFREEGFCSNPSAGVSIYFCGLSTPILIESRIDLQPLIMPRLHLALTPSVKECKDNFGEEKKRFYFKSFLF